MHSLPILLSSLAHLPADQVSNPAIALSKRVYSVRAQQPEAGLTLARNLDAWIEDCHILKPTGKEEILIKTGALNEAFLILIIIIICT